MNFILVVQVAVLCYDELNKCSHTISAHAIRDVRDRGTAHDTSHVKVTPNSVLLDEVVQEDSCSTVII